MTVRIIKGDCRQELSSIGDGSVDLVLTDPPYGETSLAWDKWPIGWLKGLRRVMAPHASLWMFGSQQMFLKHGSEIAAAGFRYAQDVIWEKHNGSGNHADRFRRVHEHAVQFYPADRKWATIFKKPLFTDDAVARVVRRKKKGRHIGEISASTHSNLKMAVLASCAASCVCALSTAALFTRRRSRSGV